MEAYLQKKIKENARKVMALQRHMAIGSQDQRCLMDRQKIFRNWVNEYSN